MSKQTKISDENRIQAVRDYFDGKGSYEAIAQRYNVSKSTILRIINKAKAGGICCYGQDGQPISSKTVCCKAQDMSFTGIANITAAYIYTHVDVRSGGKWYGDEVHGNSSVTDDFYISSVCTALRPRSRRIPPMTSSPATPSGWHTGVIRRIIAALTASGSIPRKAVWTASTAMLIWISATRISRPSSRRRG